MHYVLDMDGVIFATTGVKHSLLVDLFPPEFRTEISSYNKVAGGIPRSTKMDHIFREICPELAFQKQAILNHYQEKVAGIYNDAALVNGVLHFLKNTNSIKWLATSAPLEDAKMALKTHDLEKHFDRIEGYPRTKACILKDAILASNGDLVFIGDTLSDLNIAVAVSVPFIGLIDKDAAVFPKGTDTICDFAELF